MKIAFLPRNEHHFQVFSRLCDKLDSEGFKTIVLSQFGEDKHHETYCFSNYFDTEIGDDASLTKIDDELREKLNKYISADRDIFHFHWYYPTLKSYAQHTSFVRTLTYRWVKEVGEFFEKHQDVNLIISELTSGLFDGILFHEASKRGIKYISIRQSKLTDGVIFCSPLNDLPLDVSKNEMAKKKIEEAASAYIDAARTLYERPSYMEVTKRNHEFSVKNITDFIHRFNFAKSRGDTLFFLKTIWTPSKWYLFKFYNRMNLKIMRRSFRKNIDITNQKYVVFPLHYEPESSVTIRGFPYEQVPLIRLIAKSLPYDITLVVKEHAGNKGYRKVRDYKNILQMHNVVLVTDDFDNLSLIQNSLGIITITGRMGWEGLLNYKPVVSYGKSFWSDLAFSDLDDFIDALKRNPDDECENKIREQALYNRVFWYLNRTHNANFVMKSKKLLTNENISALAQLIKRFAILV